MGAGAVAGAGSGGGENEECGKRGSGRGLRWGWPTYLSPCSAAILSAFVCQWARNVLHQERLQNLLQHCGQDKAVKPIVDHVADMCERL